MPIWLSIGLAVSAAVGTYILAPIINEDFEYQKNRSTHLINTINDVNKDIIDLSTSARKFNNSIFYHDEDLLENRSDTLDKITELQWRLIDVGVILKRNRYSNESVDSLSHSLDVFRAEVIEAQKPEDQEKVISSFSIVASNAKLMVNTLYMAARIGDDSTGEESSINSSN